MGTVLNGLRIVIALKTLELGGAERNALRLARHFALEQGADVQIWGFRDKLGLVAEYCEEYGIPWRTLRWGLPTTGSPIRRLKRLAWFVRELRRANPDVILPYIHEPNVACGLVWRWTGARLCIWNQRDVGKAHVKRQVEKLAVRWTPWFVSNSHAGADFLVQTLGAKPDRVRVIRNGVDLPAPQLDQTAWRTQLGVDEDCFLVCMIANLTRYKDHATLLKAWPRVVGRLRTVGRQAVLVLAGRFGDTYDPLKMLTYDLGIDSNIRLLGLVKDISGLISTIDLGVLSSRSEGCPNALLECMAAGLAVVGTDTPGIREAVGVGYRYLSPPGDSEALADRIIEFAMDPKLGTKVGAQNHHRIETEFSPQQFYKKMTTLIIEGLMERQPDPGDLSAHSLCSSS